MNFTNEQLNKAKQAKSADELFEMAKAEGVSMTADEAAKYFAELNKQGELSDDELDAVAGGKGDEERQPQEYQVAANSHPCCDGYYENRGNISKYFYQTGEYCGNCRHFKFDGKLTVSTEGVCRREFEQ